MKILLPVISYHYLTGSEMYVYELARELIYRGHDVTVASTRIGGALEEPSRKAGIRSCLLHDDPAMSGNWDMIHASEPYPTQWALRTHPFDPIIVSVHSQYPCEQPIVDPRVCHYVCIRPEVQKKIIEQDRIPASKTSVVYNPIDFRRFHPDSSISRKDQPRRVLFCGTIDLLRKATIFDLFRRAKQERFELWLLGLKADCYSKAGNYIDALPPGVKWFDQNWNTESFIHQCDETAGILLGRTTIEGWACGKPGWIYSIDLQGGIISKKLHPPPTNMSQFDSMNVVNQLEALYERYRYGKR